MRETKKFLFFLLTAVTLLGCGENRRPIVYVPQQENKTEMVACGSVPSCRLDCNELYDCQLQPNIVSDVYYQCLAHREACYATEIPR